LSQSSGDALEVEVTVSSGFYVRSLAHDIGEALACGGHLRRLVRTSIGPIRVEQAATQAELEDADDPAAIVGGSRWIPMSRIPLPFPDVDLNPTATDRFVHGQEVIVFRSGDEELATGQPVAVRHDDGLLGIGLVQNVLARGRSVSLRPTLVLEG
jgi:tRNA U55 pseudouridine synthase TruB